MFHYLPALLGLIAPFLIDVGYQLLKGTKGNKRYGTVIILSYIASILGIWFGFTFSIYFLWQGEPVSYFNLVSDIMSVMRIYPSFRLSFILFAIFTLVFTTIGVIIKFTTMKEVKESEMTTMDKLN